VSLITDSLATNSLFFSLIFSVALSFSFHAFSPSLIISTKSLYSVINSSSSAVSSSFSSMFSPSFDQGAFSILNPVAISIASHFSSQFP